jgi:hypothetical protein
MKLTAVEWLQEQLNPDMKTMQGVIIQELFERAKEMERGQIREAFINGEVARDRIDSIEYYQETYGK